MGRYGFEGFGIRDLRGDDRDTLNALIGLRKPIAVDGRGGVSLAVAERERVNCLRGVVAGIVVVAKSLDGYRPAIYVNWEGVRVYTVVVEVKMVIPIERCGGFDRWRSRYISFTDGAAGAWKPAEKGESSQEQ